MSNILVIDDEDLVRETLRQMLEDGGHEVIEASNGEEGVRQFLKHGADLIVTDVIMPEKEGIETIIELTRDYPDLRIIAISGGGRTKRVDYLEIAERFGAAAVMAKPFDQQTLLSEVDRCLNGN